MSNRVFAARQKLLIQALGSDCIVEEVKIGTQTDGGDQQYDMDYRAAEVYFKAGELIRKHNPDIVLIRGDRFTELMTAAVATYHRKIIAHIESGDVSSSVDEHVRHAITKLAHIHFVTNEKARERVIRMGENPALVYNFGSLDAEFAVVCPKQRLYPDPYILILHHEIKGEEGSYEKIKEELEKVPLKKVYVKSNNDFATEKGEQEFSPENFISLLAYAKCIVGNSSSSIKEASVLGVPAIVVGSRQDGRLRANNVIDLKIEEIPDLVDAIDTIIGIKCTPNHIYFRPYTAEKIAKILLDLRPEVQKKFYD